MENKTTEVFGANVERLPLKDLIKRIGPGLIATGIVIGPGAITTAAMLGSNFGYTLIWLIIPIVFMGITFMMVTNRLAIVTGMPTIHAIRKYYGPVAAGFVGIALFSRIALAMRSSARVSGVSLSSMTSTFSRSASASISRGLTVSPRPSSAVW